LNQGVKIAADIFVKTNLSGTSNETQTQPQSATSTGNFNEVETLM
jgi:hypothetical protein